MVMDYGEARVGETGEARVGETGEARVGETGEARVVWVCVAVDWDFDMTERNLEFLGVFDSEEAARGWCGGRVRKNGEEEVVFKARVNDPGPWAWPIVADVTCDLTTKLRRGDEKTENARQERQRAEYAVRQEAEAARAQAEREEAVARRIEKVRELIRDWGDGTPVPEFSSAKSMSPEDVDVALALAEDCREHRRRPYRGWRVKWALSHLRGKVLNLEDYRFDSPA